MSRISIQAALDTSDLERAVTIASQIADAVDRIEIGTILLRQHGMEAIRVLRRALSGVTLIADCKIMDCGFAETMLAIDAGADGVIVEAAAPLETIRAVCDAAASRDAVVMADGLGISDVSSLSPRLKGLPIAHVIIHTGKDEQALHGPPPLEQIHAAAVNQDLPPLAVAGGLSPANVVQIIREPRIDLIIVGRAIVSSDTPKDVLSEMRQLCDRERDV